MFNADTRQSVSINLHRPEPPEFEEHDSGVLAMGVGDFPNGVTMYFDDYDKAMQWFADGMHGLIQLRDRLIAAEELAKLQERAPQGHV